MGNVILGAGNVGFQLAKQLIEEGKDVVLIDKDPETAKHASNLLDCMVMSEEGNNLDTLKRAGIQKAEYFICVTNSDEVNMIACGMVASEFQVPHKIARIRNIVYSGTGVLRQPFLGIDFFVNPEIEASRAIVSAIERGAVSDVVFFERSGLQMRSITVTAASVFVDKSIEQLRELVGMNFLVAVILRENQYVIPRGDSVIQENDKLYLVAAEDSFDRIFSLAGKSRLKFNRIAIVGGSTVGKHVAETILHSAAENPLLSRLLRRFTAVRKRKVTIIDRDYKRCRQLSDDLPEALVINADISDEQFSEEEQLSDADLVIATTDNQELNIVNAVYAKTLGARRTIALVNKTHYVHVASNLGIDVTVSPIESMVGSILQYMRRANIQGVHSISGGKVEVVELIVVATSRAAEQSIRDLKLPGEALILSVTRGDKEIIPRGDLTLHAGDSLILIAPKELVTKVEEIFTK